MYSLQLLKLHIETDEIKTQAELVNAACGIWMSLFIEYILNLYAYIPRQLHLVIAENIFLRSTEHFG